MNQDAEVVELIATLHAAEQRLEELTSGEVDSIMDPDGRSFLLRHAQDQLRHSEAAKRILILQLESANEELETIGNSISHDLRVPLRHMQCFVELLQQKKDPAFTEENLRYLATISRSVKQMGDLIDNLLTYSRAGRAEIQKTDVDLGLLVKDTVSDFQEETTRRGIAWHIHPLPTVRADAALLRMALVNLISNAVKFTGTRSEPSIEIGCVASGSDETVIYIRDNGAGFDQKQAGKLFGMFQRLHPESEFEGTGIGLANVQRIVQRHGGRTWAEGTVDGGATFFFTIALAAGGRSPS